MSSNLRIKKVCQFCYSEFIAKTSVTKYCCLKCAQKAYKQREREKKLSKIKNETVPKESSKSDSKKKEKIRSIQNDKKGEITGEITNDVILGSENKNDVITVKEAADQLCVTKKTVYNMIKHGKLEAYNIHKRLTRIKKASLDQLIDFDLKKSDRSNTFDLENTYTITEISEKFNISASYVYHTLKEYDVPKKNDGKFVKVPKNIIDLIFKNFI
jgi:excisionase family DNA binding protein